jgi:hypothetical protein
MARIGIVRTPPERHTSRVQACGSPDRFNGRTRSGVAAACAALLFHLSAAALLLLRPTEARPGFTGASIRVSLVRGAVASGAPTLSPTLTADQRFDALQRQLEAGAPRSQPTTVSSPTPTNLSQLLDGDRRGSPGARPDPTAQGAPLLDDPYSRASLGPLAPARPAGDPIVSRARACWTGASHATPIHVEFRLSAGGNLVGEPRVRRSPTIPMSETLVADERRAVKAIRDCAPYPVIASGGTPSLFQLDLD